MNIRSLLLASHGTPGAIAAETAALDLLPAGGTLHHLLVVPDFWKGMMGDDWLNNAATQDRFGRYVEGRLEGEVDAELARVAAAAKAKGVDYSCQAVVGKPAECLLQAEGASRYDIVVIGSPRPKGATGLRSRMALEVLVKALKTPLMVVPYPGR